MAGSKKLKIFGVIILVSSLVIYFAQKNIIWALESGACQRLGTLDSPIFDLGATSTITKLLWKGVLEQATIEFELAGSLSLNSNNNLIDPQVITLSPPPLIVYTLKDEEGKFLLTNIRYFRYKIKFEACDPDSIPRVDQIFIYYLPSF